MARTEVASGEAGSVPERPGLGWGPARARDPPREHPRVGGPGPPRLPRRGGPNFQPHFAHPPSSPPPYGNLQPQKVTRRRFLGPSARPPPPGQRSCSGDSGRGSGFLGQNLLGRPGRATGRGRGGGGGRTREPLPRFFFPSRIYPFLSLLQALASWGDERGPGAQ